MPEPLDDAVSNRAAEVVRIQDCVWFDPRMHWLILAAQECIKPFNEEYIDRLQDYLESIMDQYIEKKMSDAITRARQGDFSPAEMLFGYPLIQDGEITIFAPRGVSIEQDDCYGAMSELQLTNSDKYGDDVVDALLELSRLERLDQIVDEMADRDPAASFEFTIPELYAVLALSILASTIDLEGKRLDLTVDGVLEAAEAIHIAETSLLSDRDFESRTAVNEERKRRVAGGRARHADSAKLREYAIETYANGQYKSRRQASQKIAACLATYASENGLKRLSEAQAQKTVYGWLTRYDKEQD